MKKKEVSTLQYWNQDLYNSIKKKLVDNTIDEKNFTTNYILHIKTCEYDFEYLSKKEKRNFNHVTILFNYRICVSIQ